MKSTYITNEKIVGVFWYMTKNHHGDNTTLSTSQSN